MKINPLDTYEEAKYPSVKDARSNKMNGGKKKLSGATKSGAVLLMASLTALAISSCYPKEEDSGRGKPTNGEGATNTRSFWEFVTGSNKITEPTDGYEFPSLMGDVMIVETEPVPTESLEDPVFAGIMIAPTTTEPDEYPALAGEMIITE